MIENQILKKLQLTDQNPVLIINAPEEFQETLADIRQGFLKFFRRIDNQNRVLVC